MSVKDVRASLYGACEAISAVADTIHDELHAPHWKPKLAELEKEDLEEVERLVGEADKNLEDPEGESEDDVDEAGDKADLKDAHEPDSSSSEIPDGSDGSDSESAKRTKTASLTLRDRILMRFSNSSVPVETLPGPRVQHLDRGDVDQTGPFGSYNTEEPQSMNDPWSKSDGVGNEYLYESEWENERIRTLTPPELRAMILGSVTVRGMTPMAKEPEGTPTRIPTARECLGRTLNCQVTQQERLGMRRAIAPHRSSYQ
jgi:hypothetical protein